MLSQLEEEEGVLYTGELGFLWDEFSSFLDGGLPSFFAGLVFWGADTRAPKFSPTARP